MKRVLRKISFYLVFFFSICFLTFGETEIDTEKIIYKEEINVSGIKVSDFLFYLSKEGGVEIVPEESIKEKNIDIFCKEGATLTKILSILCESNEWKAKRKRDIYLFLQE